MRQVALLLTALLVATGVVGGAAASASEATVTINPGGPAPRHVAGPPGLTVTIVNDDTERHRLRARVPDDVDTGNLEPGSSSHVTLTVAGTYEFVDERTEDPADGLTVTIAAPKAGSGGADEAPATGTGQDGNGTAPSTAEVSIPDRLFTPRDVTIAVGGTVTWRNLDGAHTVTGRDGGFDSGVFEDGQTYSETFTTAGSYAYLCRLHPEMTGAVSVVGADGAAPEPAPDEPASSPQPGPQPATPSAGPGASAAAPPTGDGGAGSIGAVTVEIADFAFAPRDVSVPAGSTLTWVNRGRAPHTVTSPASGPLDSGMVEPSASYRQQLTEPGVYEYLCTLHPEMIGRIAVTGTRSDPSEATSSSPPAAPLTDPEVPSEAAPGDGPRVRATEQTFDPARVEVEVGTTVTWEMADDQPHTVTGDSFDSGILAPGATFTTTFDTPGTYIYACLVHRGMEGEVVVTAAGDEVRQASLDLAVGSGPAPPPRQVPGESSGLSFAATVLLLGMVAAFVTGRVTARGPAT